MNIPEDIKDIMRGLLDNDFEAYVIGGAVRDNCLGIEPHDYDVFTNATGKDILRIFPYGKVLGGKERQKKILTVIVNGVEVSQYRSNGERTETGKSLEDHQSTCDFTMNAMAVDINGERIETKYTIDGHDDLMHKVLRFVGTPEDRIKEDKLRILRGVRFIIKYNLDDSDDEISFALEETYLGDIPKERVRDELIKILSLDFDISYYDIYLYHFLPKELFTRSMFEDGGVHHDETPYEHLCNAFNESCKLTGDWRNRLAAYLHDIGKAVARTEDETGVHFYQHHKVGADIVRAWMNEYKFAPKDIDYVTCIIYNHMHGYNDKEPSKRSYIKLFKNLEDNKVSIQDFAAQLYYDNQGNEAKPRCKFLDWIKNNKYINEYYFLKYSKEPFSVKDLCINGNDLIERYELKQGQQIGNVLKVVHDKILDGDLRNERAGIFFFIERSITIMR